MPWINPRLKPGERRRVITGIPGKTGIVYTLDRQTGEFLWARPTVQQNVIADIDGATGEVTVNPETLFTADGQTRVDLPEPQRRQELAGGRLQPADQHDVLPAAEHLHDDDVADRSSDADIALRLQQPQSDRAGQRRQGRHDARDLGRDGQDRWKYEQRAGDDVARRDRRRLLFGGDANGRFRAFDQDTGRCCGK